MLICKPIFYLVMMIQNARIANFTGVYCFDTCIAPNLPMMFIYTAIEVDNSKLVFHKEKCDVIFMEL